MKTFFGSIFLLTGVLLSINIEAGHAPAETETYQLDRPGFKDCKGTIATTTKLLDNQTINYSFIDRAPYIECSIPRTPVTRIPAIVHVRTLGAEAPRGAIMANDEYYGKAEVKTESGDTYELYFFDAYPQER